MLQFGLGLTAGHPYKSQPWNWLLLSRPVSFYYATPKTCGAASCSQEVLAIGTPFIWYRANLALLACLAWWLIRRDWRAGRPAGAAPPEGRRSCLVAPPAPPALACLSR